jgi:hypothetical protein
MFSIKLLSRSTFTFISRIHVFTRFTSSNYSKCVQPTPQILEVPAAELETSKGNLLNDFLIDYTRVNQSTTSFTTLLKQLNSNANLKLPYILPYENIGRKNITGKSDLAQGIVTIAHILPLRDKVVFASGFAVLDGGLIVTCAHTFYQAARHLSSPELDQKSQSIVITHEGELIPVASIESHLVVSDLVLLRLQEGRKITSLAVDPYPAPVSTPVLSCDFVTASLSPTSLPAISYSWKSAEVLFYKGRCGQEVETGTYDELSSVMYSHPPSNGSSGGPIVNKETRSVIGIVRGSEVSYANRKRIGFATPSESLFEAFKLPGMPDGVE